jgi:hypothetical protein
MYHVGIIRVRHTIRYLMCLLRYVDISTQLLCSLWIDPPAVTPCTLRIELEKAYMGRKKGVTFVVQRYRHLLLKGFCFGDDRLHVVKSISILQARFTSSSILPPTVWFICSRDAIVLSKEPFRSLASATGDAFMRCYA